ncbi:copper resistance protein NlpE N-terminal domain-containing protein [Halomonas sp. SSL-5]|uniref:copper resistance protein NlpE N-terminal domain-containing protein n=1 Tax=Halomonas sp. SSL-5 TaxID=3065855 RepID=UPI002739B566|nr:copper resistance protein NlpE N-terminal domain-containing protein [Halomonas sp. SSL-5]MDY7117720.1 copper resistance protein NlpE N-terminal domain-containing protein [Halomonas sp. SSL-5]
MQIRTLLAGSALLALLAGCAAGPTGGPEGAAVAPDEERYQGTLPCRNCDGIDLDVLMRGDAQAAAADRTFELSAAYRGHPQSPPDETYAGNWEVLQGTANEPDATVYELTPDGEGQIYYFLRLDPQTLELIDPERRRFQNSEMLQLKRQ